MKARATIDDVMKGRARSCVVHGDSAEVLKTLESESIDAIVQDPPSGVGFMNLRWDTFEDRHDFARVIGPIVADEYRVVKVGGRSLTWALPPTTHWTGCVIEDARWHIENVIDHVFASGMPKAKSQLKPAHEHWWLARKMKATHLNMNACRVGDSKRVPASVSRGTGHVYGKRTIETREHDGHRSDVGRWAPNWIASHHPFCACVGTKRVPTGTATFKNTNEGDVLRSYSGGLKRQARGEYGHAESDGMETMEDWRCVEGCPVGDLERQCEGASRFFPTFQESLAEFCYVSKPSRAEKDAGCEDLSDEVADAYASHRSRRMASAPLRIDGKRAKVAKNAHPTPKGVELMSWLVRLIAKPGEIVLDPFGGSGGTGLGALAEDCRVILVEAEERSVETALRRLALAESMIGKPTKARIVAGGKARAASIEAEAEAIARGQRSLF